MIDYTENIEQKTTIWEIGKNGLALVKTFQGLPFGTTDSIFIDGLGKANRSGIQTTGSGTNENIVEVKYTLK